MSTITHTDNTGLDQLTPSTTPARDATHFRNIVAAKHDLATANKRLRLAVEQARAAGESWTTIGVALGTTRQAAQQRFAR